MVIPGSTMALVFLTLIRRIVLLKTVHKESPPSGIARPSNGC